MSRVTCSSLRKEFFLACIIQDIWSDQNNPFLTPERGKEFRSEDEYSQEGR